MRIGILALFIIFTAPSFAKEKALRVAYYNHLFGHIHKNPSRYSISLSTISCGHPIKIMGTDGKVTMSGNFYKVNVGPYKGYISKKYLNKKKPDCFQDRYPRFFDNLDMSLTDMYYWGKLYDQYVYGRSTVK